MSGQVLNPFLFCVQKAVQAAGVVLREEPGHKMNYMKLLKLLYIAERESLRHSGRMIIGSRIFAVQRGLILGEVLDLINSQHMAVGVWDKHIDRERYNLSLKSSPGVGDLCRLDINLLQEITRRHKEDDEWDMVKITHQFKEWENNKPGSSRKEIPISEILEAVGRKKETPDILKELASQRRMDKIFSSFVNGVTGTNQ